MSADSVPDDLPQTIERETEVSAEASAARDATRNRRPYAVLLGVAIVFGILGQYYFLRRREYLLDGVVFYGVAAALFLVVVRAIEGHSADGDRETSASALDRLALWARSDRWAATGLSVSLFCGLLAGRIARGDGGYWTGLWLWVLSLGLFLAALVVPPRLVVPDQARLRQGIAGRYRRFLSWLVAYRWELIAVGLVTLFALVVRVYDLVHIPANFGGDEAEMGLEARRVLAGEKRNMFATGWLSHPTLFFFMQAFFLKFIDDGIFGLRFLSVLIGTLAVPALYLLLRSLFDRRTALVSATILAGYHFHIHFSRVGVNNIGDTLFASLVLYFFVRGTNTGRLRDYGVAGLLAGISLYFYTGARLIPIIAGAYALYLALTDRSYLRKHLGGLTLFGFGILIGVLPLAAFYHKFPDAFFARMNQVGIIQSGWLAREREITGRSTWSLLFDQFKKSVLAYNYYKDPTFWYRPGTPLLRFVSSVLFVFGLTYTVYRGWGDRRYFLIGAWFWLTVILAGTLTENPPSSMRLVIVTPALAAIIGIAVTRLASISQVIFNEEPDFAIWISAALVFVVVVTSLQFYFREYTPSRVYGNPTAEIGTELSEYLMQRQGDFKVYYFGPPFQYFTHGTIRFMTHDSIDGVDVLEPLQGPPDFIDRSRDALLVFVPARVNELPQVRGWVPGGRTWERRTPRGQLLFAVYEVPAE